LRLCGRLRPAVVVCMNKGALGPAQGRHIGALSNSNCSIEKISSPDKRHRNMHVVSARCLFTACFTALFCWKTTATTPWVLDHTHDLHARDIVVARGGSCPSLRGAHAPPRHRWIRLFVAMDAPSRSRWMRPFNFPGTTRALRMQGRSASLSQTQLEGRMPLCTEIQVKRCA
jgi:hypothetical protein